MNRPWWPWQGLAKGGHQRQNLTGRRTFSLSQAASPVLGSQTHCLERGSQSPSPLPRGLSHTRGKPRGVTHGVEKGERGRQLPGDPQAGLSHARLGLDDPSPFPETRNGKRICPQTTEPEPGERAGVGGKHAPDARARAAPVPMVTGGVSQLQGGVPPSAGTVPESWGSPCALGRGAASFRSGRKGLTAAPSRVSP